MRYIARLAVVAMLASAFAFSSIVLVNPPASAAPLTDCRFSKAQIFDVQWNMSGGNLNISSVTYPYSSTGQLNDGNLLSTDYFMFVDSTANPGKLTLEQFASDGTFKRLMNTHYDPQALGDGFIFVLGGGFYGTVLTTGEGLAYGSSRTLPVSNSSPTVDDLKAYTSCISTPLAAGQTVEDLETDPVPADITSGEPSDGQTGVAYSHQVTADGDGPLTFAISSGSLPPGVTINTETGLISGTPTAPGTYTFTVRVTSGETTDEVSYTVEIAEAAIPITVTSGVPGSATNDRPYSFQLEAEGDPAGTMSYTVGTGGLPDGLTLNSATGLISGTPTQVGSSTFTVIFSDGITDLEVEYTIEVVEPVALSSDDEPDLAAEGLPFSFTVPAEGVGTLVFSISDGALPDGMSIDSATGVISGTPTTPGTFGFTVTVTNGLSTLTVDYSIRVAPEVSMTSGVPGSATKARSYSFQLDAEGDPGQPVTYSVSAGSLPEGLSLDASTGLISGTPTNTGPATFTIRVTDGITELEVEYTIDVLETPESVSFTSGDPMPGAVGTEYTFTLSADGADTISYSVVDGSLPDGLSRDAATGEITGSPTTPGTYTFTVVADNGDTTDTVELSIVVYPLAVIELPTEMPEPRVGMPYSFTFVFDGGPSTSFRVSAGALPPGLTLDPVTGVVSGIPSAKGDYSFTIEATDGVTTATIEVHLRVAESLVDLAYTGMTSGPGVLISAGAVQLLSGLSLVWMAIAYRRRLFAPNRALIRWLLLHPTPRW